MPDLIRQLTMSHFTLLFCPLDNRYDSCAKGCRDVDNTTYLLCISWKLSIKLMQCVVQWNITEF